VTYVVVSSGHLRGLSGLGTTAAKGPHKLPIPVIHKCIKALTETLQAAKGLADQFMIAETGKPVAFHLDMEKGNLLPRSVVIRARSTQLEHAIRFVDTVQGMVVNLISVRSTGRYAWEDNPALIRVVADYVESEGRDMLKMQRDLLSLPGQLANALRALAKAVAEAAADAAEAAAEASLEIAKRMAKAAAREPLGALVIVAGLALLAFVATR
jgi:hypothetical protein